MRVLLSHILRFFFLFFFFFQKIITGKIQTIKTPPRCWRHTELVVNIHPSKYWLKSNTAEFYLTHSHSVAWGHHHKTYLGLLVRHLGHLLSLNIQQVHQLQVDEKQSWGVDVGSHNVGFFHSFSFLFHCCTVLLWLAKNKKKRESDQINTDRMALIKICIEERPVLCFEQTRYIKCSHCCKKLLLEYKFT